MSRRACSKGSVNSIGGRGVSGSCFCPGFFPALLFLVFAVAILPRLAFCHPISVIPPCRMDVSSILLRLSQSGHFQHHLGSIEVDLVAPDLPPVVELHETDADALD